MHEVRPLLTAVGGSKGGIRFRPAALKGLPPTGLIIYSIVQPQQVSRIRADIPRLLSQQPAGLLVQPAGNSPVRLLRPHGHPVGGRIVPLGQRVRRRLLHVGILPQERSIGQPAHGVAVLIDAHPQLFDLLPQRSRIGSAPQYENSWQYAQLDGDTRLLSVSRGLAEECYVTRGSLHSVEQLTIHADRLDEITLLNAEGEITQQWHLNGAITNADAQDRWMLTTPVSYPADGTAMNTLRKSAANIRLGEYIADATAESIARYGLDTPRIVIRLHQAAGTIGAVGTTGSYATTDYPEATITLVIGEQESDLVDYVLYDGGIYRCSTLLLRGVMNADWQETITRYPVLTALGNLASLSRETADGVDTWVITRTEQVAENNELVTDDEGNQVYDIALTKNGESADYTAFSAAYNQLMMVTMSGRLPDGWTAADAPHTVWTFTDVDGTVHTVALTRYDAMHDAVAVDGVALFYLIQGGFSLGI